MIHYGKLCASISSFLSPVSLSEVLLLESFTLCDECMFECDFFSSFKGVSPGAFSLFLESFKLAWEVEASLLFDPFAKNSLPSWFFSSVLSSFSNVEMWVSFLEAKLFLAEKLRGASSFMMDCSFFEFFKAFAFKRAALLLASLKQHELFSFSSALTTLKRCGVSEKIINDLTVFFSNDAAGISLSSAFVDFSDEFCLLRLDSFIHPFLASGLSTPFSFSLQCASFEDLKVIVLNTVFDILKASHLHLEVSSSDVLFLVPKSIAVLFDNIAVDLECVPVPFSFCQPEAKELIVSFFNTGGVFSSLENVVSVVSAALN